MRRRVLAGRRIVVGRTGSRAGARGIRRTEGQRGDQQPAGTPRHRRRGAGGGNADGEQPAAKLKDVFGLVSGLGQGQYTDLVYARDYGRAEKDIIYKIDFDKAFLFVRFLYHVDHGAWRLIRIRLKTENEEPLPKDWVHIYPR